METRRGFIGKLAGLVGLGALAKVLPAEPTGFGGAVAEIPLPGRTYTLPATSGDKITRMWRKIQGSVAESYAYVFEEYALLDDDSAPSGAAWVEFDLDAGTARRRAGMGRPIGSRSSDRKRLNREYARRRMS